MPREYACVLVPSRLMRSNLRTGMIFPCSGRRMTAVCFACSGSSWNVLPYTNVKNVLGQFAKGILFAVTKNSFWSLCHKCPLMVYSIPFHTIPSGSL